MIVSAVYIFRQHLANFRDRHFLGSARETSEDAVVATDSGSANVDYDNGTVAVYGTPRCRRCDDLTDRQLAGFARPARRRVLLLPPLGGPTQVRTTAGLRFRVAIRADGEVELGVAL